jgi:hypothetical protein
LKATEVFYEKINDMLDVVRDVVDNNDMLGVVRDVVVKKA